MHKSPKKPRRASNGHRQTSRCALGIHGWTLTEMLVCLALFGVLTGLALPAYQEQQRVARRSDGHAALLQLQNDQVRWRSENESHTESLTDLGWQSDLSPSGHYRIRVVEATADGYAVQAIGLGGQSHDRRCTPLHLRWQGSATAVWGAGEQLDSDPNRCWRR